VAKHGGVSDDAVKKATGRDWDGWISALDRAGAATRTHKDIAKLLREQLGVESGWWAQTISVGYEQAKGLRDVHQTLDGYVAGASRTLPVSAEAIYAAWTDARRRKAWLTEPFAVSKSTPGKSVRIDWPDGSRVDVYLVPKGASKTQVAIQHSKLPDQHAVAMRKAFWKEALDRLQAAIAR
jgi:Activator of Hsp90 ATPase homolog 1-like protein